MIAVVLNGRPAELPAGADVTAAVRALTAGSDQAAGSDQTAGRDHVAGTDHTAGRGIAVAVNGEVVPRSDWPGTTLADGDRVEVLSATQGG
jgi:sulfur carrier protein